MFSYRFHVELTAVFQFPIDWEQASSRSQVFRHDKKARQVDLFEFLTLESENV
jgi:hypothetical protein